MSSYKTSDKLNYPSASRNSQPISETFCTKVDLKTPNLHLLEIASGSGQHAACLAPRCPNITFHPSEFEKSLFKSIKAYAADCPTKNIREPVFVDITSDPMEWGFPKATFDYMFNSNMMHISPWECSIGLFRAAGQLLKPNGLLLTYGPYAVNGVLTPESNVNFDLSLKSQNSKWGVRDIVDLKKLAKENGITLIEIDEMPSNNKFLTWKKN